MVNDSRFQRLPDDDPQERKQGVISGLFATFENEARRQMIMEGTFPDLSQQVRDEIERSRAMLKAAQQAQEQRDASPAARAMEAAMARVKKTRGKTMGTLIKELRDGKGWTQAKLAERAGVTQGFISQLEQGIRVKVTLESAGKLARALGVDVGELLKGGGR